MKRYSLTCAGKFWLSYPLIVVVGIAWGVRAYAAHVEVGAGVAHSQATENGNWYELGVGAPQLDLTSPVFMLGLTGNFSTHFGWHVDAVDLGRNSVDSRDVVNDRRDYSWSAHQCLATCSNLMHVTGSGGVYGIAATLEAHTSGPWTFGIEAGPFLYHASWSVSVPDWQRVTHTDAAGGPWTYSGGSISTSTSQWKVGDAIGVYARHRNLGLSLRVYRDGTGIGQYDLPPIWSTQIAAVVTYRF